MNLFKRRHLPRGVFEFDYLGLMFKTASYTVFFSLTVGLFILILFEFSLFLFFPLALGVVNGIALYKVIIRRRQVYPRAQPRIVILCAVLICFLGYFVPRSIQYPIWKYNLGMQQKADGTYEQILIPDEAKADGFTSTTSFWEYLQLITPETGLFGLKTDPWFVYGLFELLLAIGISGTIGVWAINRPIKPPEKSPENQGNYM